MAQPPSLGNGSFTEGTRIATPAGPVAVEQLKRGDAVLTDAGPAPLTVVQPHAAAAPSVRVKANAFGPGIPAVDVLRSTEHMLYLRDSGAAEAVLVPAGALINGASIARLPIVAAVPWVTIGVARHAVVLADGLPVGTLRPDGAPLAARQLPPGPALFALRGRVGRGEVAAEWSAPAPPARPAPAQDKDMPVLQLLADGSPAPARGADTAWQFTVPPGSRELRLVSPVGRPSSDADGRRFGVAVRALLLDGIPLALDGPVAGDGFYAVEGAPRVPGGAWRWTNGDAHLLLPAAKRPRRLEVTLTDWHAKLRREG